MWDDIVKSVRAVLYERTVSPLFGAFALSWIVWNHRLVVVLFSSMPVADKFSFIDNSLYPTVWKFSALLILGPLATALAFIYLYPFPARKVYEHWRKNQKELKAVRQRIEDETPLTQEEAKQLRRRLIQLPIELDTQMKSLTERNDELVRQLAEASKREDEWASRLQSATASPPGSPSLPHLSDMELEAKVIGKKYELVHNPKEKRSRPVTFRQGGALEGSNKFEHRWQAANGLIEMLQSNGEVHSRFHYAEPTGMLISINDPDTPAARDQFMIPQ